MPSPKNSEKMPVLPRNKVFEYAFLTTGLLVQVVTYCLMPSGWLSLVSGLLGICSVVLCSQGNILSFVFGFGQVITYTYLCIAQRFYGEIAINIYYFLTMLYGVYAWRKRLKTTEGEEHTINARHLSKRALLIIAAACAVGAALAGFLLARYTDDTQPYLDAFTTVPAIVAQLLMVAAYREQWYLWLAVDVLSMAMWLVAGNYCLAAQYLFWCANCVYGLYYWKKL